MVTEGSLGTFFCIGSFFDFLSMTKQSSLNIAPPPPPPMMNRKHLLRSAVDFLSYYKK